MTSLETNLKSLNCSLYRKSIDVLWRLIFTVNEAMTYYSAAKRPEPPHEQQSQQQKQHQQRDEEDCAVKLSQKQGRPLLWFTH